MAKIKKENAIDKKVVPKKSIEELEMELKAAIKQRRDALPRCGHVNSHSRNINGEKDDLSCTRPEGHTGNHKAEHEQWNPLSPRVAESQAGGAQRHYKPGKEGDTIMNVAEWKDSAGSLSVVVEEDWQPDLDESIAVDWIVK